MGTEAHPPGQELRLFLKATGATAGLKRRWHSSVRKVTENELDVLVEMCCWQLGPQVER